MFRCFVGFQCSLLSKLVLFAWLLISLVVREVERLADFRDFHIFGGDYNLTLLSINTKEGSRFTRKVFLDRE